MKKNIIIISLVLILSILIFLIYIGTPNVKATYNLKSSDIINYREKANQCDINAIQSLIAHYAVNRNKVKFNKWREKEEKCQSKVNFPKLNKFNSYHQSSGDTHNKSPNKVK